MSDGRKILAIASQGGHWIQLMRLMPALEGHRKVIVSTNPGHAGYVKGATFYAVRDASRWDRFNLLRMAWDIWRIVRKERPDFVVTTGAAPGLISVISGRLSGATTIWIDSIANAEELSMSGRMARRFATIHLTQWPELARGRTKFKGTVLS